MMIEEDLTWGGKYIIQHTDDVLQNYIPETYRVLLTDITLIHLIKNKLITLKKALY